jgi:dipeptidyl aminopeptidase/acylaminoacyl peptidase
MKRGWLVTLVAGCSVVMLGSAAPLQATDGDDATAAPTAGSAETRPALIPVRHFATRAPIRHAELSPDGMTMAFYRDHLGQSEFFRADPATGRTLGSFFLPDGFEALSYDWAGSDRVIISAVGVIATERYYYRVRRLFVADLASGAVRDLIADPLIASDADLVHIAEDGSAVLVAHKDKSTATDAGVYRYDLAMGGGGTLVHAPIKDVFDWFADESGAVRLALGRSDGKWQVWYRSDPSGPLTLSDSYSSTDRARYYGPVHLLPGTDVGLAFRRGKSGKIGLHRFDFRTRQSAEVIHEEDGWDLESVTLDNGRPILAEYTDDQQRYVWLDKEIGALYRQLTAALGGEDTELRVISRSKDGRRMLLWGGHEADPGVVYFWDGDRKAMNELAPMRPELDYTLLARSRHITYSARDGTSISGYLTMPRGREPRGLPLIILPHGGPYGVRDSRTFDDDVQLLANRGYAVLQPNFRGSGGYGDEFTDLGEGQIGRAMQDDLDDAMDWAVAQGIADRTRVCMVGGSYGGYAALWAVLRNPERYRCAASWAGVTDWDRILKYDRRFLDRADRQRWRARVRGEQGFDLNSVSPARLAGKLSRPTLLAHGTRDRIVPFAQYEQMVKASASAPVPPTTLVVHSAGHSFSREIDQSQWLNALDNFLARHNPADQVDANGQLITPEDPALDARFKPLTIEPSGT